MGELKPDAGERHYRFAAGRGPSCDAVTPRGEARDRYKSLAEPSPRYPSPADSSQSKLNCPSTHRQLRRKLRRPPPLISLPTRAHQTRSPSTQLSPFTPPSSPIVTFCKKCLIAASGKVMRLFASGNTIFTMRVRRRKARAGNYAIWTLTGLGSTTTFILKHMAADHGCIVGNFSHTYKYTHSIHKMTIHK